MRRRARAQVIVWVAVMLPLLFLPIVGLTMDAGVVFDAKRDLQNLADGAARVGAMEIDEDVLHTSPRGEVRVHPAHADAAIRTYLFDRLHYAGPDPLIDTAHDNRAVVTVYRDIHPTFLRLLHVGPVRIRATGSAAPCAGLIVATCT